VEPPYPPRRKTSKGRQLKTFPDRLYAKVGQEQIDKSHSVAVCRRTFSVPPKPRNGVGARGLFRAGTIHTRRKNAQLKIGKPPARYVATPAGGSDAWEQYYTPTHVQCTGTLVQLWAHCKGAG
jgi:hypothetical protein